MFNTSKLESLQAYDWLWESKHNKNTQVRCPCCDLSFIDLDIEMCESCEEYYKNLKEEN